MPASPTRPEHPIATGVSRWVPVAMTLLQRNGSDGQRGRVFGALGAVEGVAIVAGTLTAGLLAGALGIARVLVAPGAG